MLIKLESKIKKQIIFAWVFLIFNIIIFALLSMLLVMLISNFTLLVISINPDKNIITILFNYIILIFAIVNAVEINQTTRNSVWLIIFTIFNIMGIAMLIAAYLEKNKIKSETHNYNNDSNINIEHSK